MTLSEQSEPTSDLRVLHVDDEVSHLDLSKEFLEMADEDMTRARGYTVTKFSPFFHFT
jgi:hypothetical protein